MITLIDTTEHGDVMVLQRTRVSVTEPQAQQVSPFGEDLTVLNSPREMFIVSNRELTTEA